MGDTEGGPIVKDATAKRARRVISIRVPLEIPIERVANLLSCAFESGGALYSEWCVVGKPRRRGLTASRKKAFASIIDRHFEGVYLPLILSCGIEIIEHGGSSDPKEWSEPVLLDLEAIGRGLALMAIEMPHAFGRFLEGSEDALVGDTFLQLCVLGKVEYR